MVTGNAFWNGNGNGYWKMVTLKIFTGKCNRDISIFS